MNKENMKRMMFSKYNIALAILLLLILASCSNSSDEENLDSSADEDSADSLNTNDSNDDAYSAGFDGTADSDNPVDDTAESDDTVDFGKPTDNDNNYGRGAVSDGADTNADGEPIRMLTEDADSIIIYFSRGGNTENVAQQVESFTGADVLELQVENPYPSDYEDTVDRADEERESGDFPALATKIPDLSQYDTIFLGHPIWSMTIANPIARFLEDNNEELSGKSIAAFSTNAGYGDGSSVDRISELSSGSIILENYTVQDEEAMDSQDDVEAWLERLGVLEEE
ncbi:flavodoxin [Oceanobacillus sp. CFH 90083]|uniref:flavodoxin family protein n=1 Tax=Oceanobacillus sp. CFH 90083 TaxID=2592336 RepID=UPI00128E76ED|nr:flavodoxin [Oceanobacillus sp. CFH 90083]